MRYDRVRIPVEGFRRRWHPALTGAFNGYGIAGCALSAIAAAIGVRLSVAKDFIQGLTRRETLDAIRAFQRVAAGVGVNFDLAGLLLSLGGLVSNA